MRVPSFALLLMSSFGTSAATEAEEAQLFAPGVISTIYNETSATFSPDGREVYFMRGDLVSSRNAILSAQRGNDGR